MVGNAVGLVRSEHFHSFLPVFGVTESRKLQYVIVLPKDDDDDDDDDDEMRKLSKCDN
jgi:hypothetical protein